MKKKIQIWHISDTHDYHHLLEVPENIDIVIHSGDFSNNRDVHVNEPEARRFLDWFGDLKIPHKILIAGNHDAFACKRTAEFKTICMLKGIVYLENDWVEIKGLKIWGSPFTPTFNNWYFNKDRSKLDAVWKQIPDDTDIVITHGPPKGMLDAVVDFNSYIKQSGCTALRKHLVGRVKPKLSLFGHLHNNEDIINAGIVKLSACITVFSNGSVVTDRKFGTLSSNGNILKI